MNEVIKKLQNDLAELAFECYNYSENRTSVQENNANYHKAMGYIECLEALGVNIGTILTQFDDNENSKARHRGKHMFNYLSINGIPYVGTAYLKHCLLRLLLSVDRIQNAKHEDGSISEQYLEDIKMLSHIKSWNIGLDFEEYETDKIKRVDNITYGGELIYSRKSDNGICEQFETSFNVRDMRFETYINNKKIDEDSMPYFTRFI